MITLVIIVYMRMFFCVSIIRRIAGEEFIYALGFTSKSHNTLVFVFLPDKAYFKGLCVYDLVKSYLVWTLDQFLGNVCFLQIRFFFYSEVQSIFDYINILLKI